MNPDLAGGARQVKGLGESRAGKPANSPVGAISGGVGLKTRAVFYCASGSPKRKRPRDPAVYNAIPLSEGAAMPIERLHPGPRMSQIVIHNKTVYLAGQVSDEAHGKSVGEQTKDILATIDSLLKEAKTDKSRILSANIWLTDMSTFGEMNKVWDAWVVPGATPARATVESARLASSEYKIEIAVIAAQP
jgi:enamine deaminase RidA (YjgF/YER057c/UK114 family)